MPSPSAEFEDLLKALNTRQLPFPKLRKALQLIGKAVKKDKYLIADFHRYGSLETILHYIEKPRVSEFALSVLANCLIDKKIRHEVLKTNCVQSLVRILTNIAEEPIRNRACRALANISMSRNGSQAVHQATGGIHAVIDFLKTTKSKDSQATAMRALGILSDSSSHRETMTTLAGPASLARCLGTVAEPLHRPCVHALEQLTRKCTFACAKQIQDAGAFPLLVELSSTLDHAFFTMMNIAHLDEMNVEVGSSGFIKILIDRLEKENFSETRWNSVFITLCRLCKDSYNLIRVRDNGGLKVLVDVISNVNRKDLWTYATYSILQYRYDDPALASLKQLHLIESLVKYLDEYTKENVQEHTLDGKDCDNRKDKNIKNDGQSDQSSMSGLSVEHENGVFSHTDTDTVASIGSDHEEEPQAKKPKMFCLNSPSYLEIMQAKSLAFNYDIKTPGDYNDFVGLPGYSGMSPRSERSPVMPDFDERSGSGSPSHSGSTSPCRTEDESENPAFSPVYDSNHGSSSTEDDDEEEKSFSFILSGTLKRSRKTSSDTRQDRKRRFSDAKPEVVAPKDIMVDHVLRIFEIYTFPRTIDLLGDLSITVCLALLRYIAAVPTSLSRAERITIVLCRHTMFFPIFISENRIFQMLQIIRKIHSKNDCSRCYYLSTVRDQLIQSFAYVASGGFGSGELANHLLGEQSCYEKEQTAMLLGFIVHDFQVLFKLLFHCGALDLIFDVLQNCFIESELSDETQRDDTRFELAVESLLEIGKTCKFCQEEIYPEPVEPMLKCDAEEIVLKENSEHGILLKVDYGEDLIVNRDLLISKSDYFEAMFRSEDFQESLSKSVHLKGANETALRTILHALSCKNHCANQIKNLGTALECLRLTHMLMMPSLEKVMMLLVISLMKAKEELVTIYPKIILFLGGSLKERCVKMMLSKDDKSTSSVKAFRKIMQSSYGGQFLEDVRTTLKLALSS